ncbi:MAG TPA: formimidoylglutamate deiminase [Burkholderiales bacterium]|nr:formimidoylglutamate deiminase [Burkholderiales bacterium]
MTSRLFAPHALLRHGWADDVVLEIDAAGTIVAATPRAIPGTAERLAGPVIPGMPDLHSHAFQRALAGRAEHRGGSGRDTFWTWRETMYRFVARLEPDGAHAIAAQLYIELLKSGYTAVAEFQYVHNGPAGLAYAEPAEMSLAHLRAANESGIALTLLPVLYAQGGFGAAPLGAVQARFAISTDGLLDLVRRMRAAAGANTCIGVAAHSLRAVSPPQLQALVDEITRLDPTAPIHIHAGEQKKEVDECVAWSGKRPVAWLLDHAQVDARWCLVHCTHLDDTEVARLGASGAVAGLCPSTEANLGDGVFRLPDFLATGGRYGIGSDSQVSRDPAEELRWLEYGQRLRQLERNIAASEARPSVGATLWDAAARGGAQALGRPTGELAPGRCADLLVLDAAHVDLAGRRRDEILDALVFSGSNGLVRDVMVGGRWVVRERHHAAEDAIATRYRKTVARLLAD